jgi:NTE family protein
MKIISAALSCLLVVGCSGSPVRETSVAPPTTQPVVPVQIQPPKIALVLGGGGARGFAHLGVLRVLEREKVPINLVVGTSVGSLIGGFYAAEGNLFEVEWKAFKIEKSDLFDFSLFSITKGPVKGEAIQEFVKKNFKTLDIGSFKIPFIAVAADLNTGELVEFTSGSAVEAIRASVSIPGVFTPALIGRRPLIDGGVVANVAVSVARNHGADIIIAVNITQNVVDYKVNDVVDITLQAINIMMSKMSETELKAADIVITPAISDVGTMDFTQKKRCIEAGLKAAEPAIAAIREKIDAYYISRGAVPPEKK